MIKKLLFISILLLGTAAAWGQQLPQYSQYIFNHYAINPAYGGTTDSWEAVSNNRLQWVGVTDAPRTFTLSVQGPTRNKKMGFGAFVYTDIVGPTRRVGAQVSYSYIFQLSEKIKLSLGISLGMNQWLLDAHKIVTNDPGDLYFSNGLIKSNDFDMKAGFWLYHDDWWVGFSAPQIIQNKLYFFDEQTSSLSIMEDHYFLNGGYTFHLHDDWDLEPSVMLKYVYPAPFKFDVTLRTIWKDMLWLGAGYRTQDAVTIMAGYNYKDYLSFGYSYDITTTPLKVASKGTHELMLSFKFAHVKPKQEKDSFE